MKLNSSIALILLRHWLRGVVFGQLRHHFFFSIDEYSKSPNGSLEHGGPSQLSLA